MQEMAIHIDMRQFMSLHIVSSEIHFIVILPARLLMGLLHRFQTSALYAFLFHLRPTCPAHLILLDLILQKKTDQEYTL
jgi:hypothetical protein